MFIYNFINVIWYLKGHIWNLTLKKDILFEKIVKSTLCLPLFLLSKKLFEVKRVFKELVPNLHRCASNLTTEQILR